LTLTHEHLKKIKKETN